MENKQLIPLHVHSNYSLLDSLIKIDDYVAWGKENNMPALACTDHGVLSSSLGFYKSCIKNGIKPILGMEAYTTVNSPNDEEKIKDNRHLILLCKNKTGWLNLIKLHNISYHNFYHKPRINYTDLEKYSEGLICLSACLGGAIPKAIMAQDNNAIIAHTNTLKNIFKDDFYIELQDHNIPEQRPVNNILVQLAKSYNLKLIATNDSHYTNKDDAYAHQVLLCKQTQSKISDEKKMSFGTNEFYLKNTEEMRSQLNYLGEEVFEECLNSSNEINNKIEEFDILQHEYNYPKFGEPQDSLAKLKKQVEIGFKKRFQGKNIDLKVYTDRLSYELETIYNTGFTDYFLVLSDLYEFCEKENVPTGFGRGSSGGSLILYCLYVTHLDPIEKKLLFERFINPDRVNPPDADCDVADTHRQIVIDYIKNKYGEAKVCNISTYSSLTSVASFKAVASVLELSYVEANDISKRLIDTQLSLQENLDKCPELNKLYNTRTDIQNIINTAMRLEGGLEKKGIHAAGVIICDKDLDTITPVTYAKDTSGNMVNCSCFEMSEVDKDLKLLKLDILGLQTLSTVVECANRIGGNVNWKEFDFKDEKTYKLLQRGDTKGVFQLESAGMASLSRRLETANFEDIGSLVALFRPGPLESGMVDKFVNRKNGSEKIECIHESLNEVLSDTYSTIVYQEQIMQICQILAGYTLGEADLVRRAMGKKDKVEMDRHRPIFINGCIKMGVDETLATELFNDMEQFAKYSFNRAHSASYAALAYTMAWMKANYPLEFMTSVLNANSDNLDKLTPYIDECYRLGINVLPPDINKSGLQFEHDKDSNAIRFGFNGIKHVGDSSIEPLVLERTNGPIESFSDLLTRIPSLNKTALESLIKVGAFNNIEKYPHKYLHTFDYMQKAKNKTDYKSGKVDLYNSLVDSYIKNTSFGPTFDEIENINKKIKKLEEEKKNLDKNIFKEERKEINSNIKKLIEDKSKLNIEVEKIYAEEKNKFEHMEFTPEIQVLKDYEMELIGFPISNNPKKEIMELCDFIDNVSLEEIKEEKQYDELFYFMGKVKTIRRCKNGSYFVVLTDEKSDISTFMKGETYSMLSDKLENTSNYFRICGRLNRSNNPNYDDNLKLESIRYFNTSKYNEIILRMPQTMSIQDLQEVLTNIKNDAILVSDDINYRLSILTHDNKKINTKIDYWVSGVQSIGSYILRYNMTVVN